MPTSQLVNVPLERARYFVCRDEMLVRLEALLVEGDVSIMAAVEGLAGIGKTELAIQLVYRLAKKGAFPGGIYWFDAENPDLKPAWGQNIADALGVPVTTLAERAGAAMRQVSNHRSETLLILDNVESWTGEDRPGPLPVGDHIKLLVTTRRRLLGGAAFEHVRVGVLDESAAEELLRNLAGRPLGDTEALLQHLEGHALAIELAGAYLAEFPSRTPEQYLGLLRSDPTVEDTVRDDLARYRQTVTGARASPSLTPSCPAEPDSKGRWWWGGTDRDELSRSAPFCMPQPPHTKPRR